MSARDAEASEEASAAWSQSDGAWVLALKGQWRGHTAALPAAPEAFKDASVRVDASALRSWDARLASSLWHALSNLGAARDKIDLSSLPPGLQQILSLALPAPPADKSPDGSKTDGDGDGEPKCNAKPRPMLRRAITAVGARAAKAWATSRETLSFFGEVTLALGRLLRGRSDLRLADLAWQLDQTGPRSLPILALVSFLVGLIVAYMGGAQLQRFGAEAYVADLVTVGVVREIAALLVGIVLAGRVGAAFAAQLGSMQANDEIDALRTMGVDPVGNLVLPRVLALLLVGPLLTAFGAVVGLAAGWLVAIAILGVSPTEYLFKSSQALSLPHVLIGLLKGTVYCALVGLAGCRQGLAAGRSAQAVGNATTNAVVQGIVWVVIAASALTVIFQRLDI